MDKNDLTVGRVYKRLIGFTLPILFAMFLQLAYSAVDLIVVGHFGTKADMSGVSTGAQLMHSLTMIITCFATGVTVYIGKKIGENNKEQARKALGTSALLFLIIAIIMTIVLEIFSREFCIIMNAPEEAFEETLSYVRICCGGYLLITMYNLLGSICRGLGDSKTPLITVGISAIINVILDLALCGIFNLGTKGVGYATIISQGISVVITYFLLKRNKNFPIEFSIKKEDFVLRKDICKEVITLGLPLALQEFLVGASFLVILSTVNKLGLDESAGVGVAHKLIGFLMIVPSSFSQSISAFTAQNIGANQIDRTNKALKYGIITSLGFAIILFCIGFFAGETLSYLFNDDAKVNMLSGQYLKAYAIDTFLTSFLFCFMGYLNGRGKTKYVMAQGLIGSFLVRIPVCLLMASLENTNLFLIGLATPCSTTLQIIMSLTYFTILKVNDKKNGLLEKDA